jgi:hypothetical protein
MKTNTTLAMLALAGFCAPALAADVTYRADIQPLIKKLCADCHGPNAPTLADFKLDEERYTKKREGPRFDSYGEMIGLIGWPDTGAIMRRLDDGTNTGNKKPGNMHKYLGETDSERAANLKLIKEWVGEDAWKLNRFKKRGDVPAASHEDMEKLKLKY